MIINVLLNTLIFDNIQIGSSDLCFWEPRRVKNRTPKNVKVSKSKKQALLICSKHIVSCTLSGGGGGGGAIDSNLVTAFPLPS